jgi:uncharacterized protein
MKKLILLFVLLLSYTLFATEYPKPVGYVNDFANVMTADQKGKLESVLSNYEKQTSVEISIVTIQSLDGQDIEEYTNELASQWGVGKKDSDNGIVILNSIGDRKIRVEVGYGLEGLVTDAYSNQLIDDVLVPELKNSKYSDAYNLAVSALMRKLGDSPDELAKRKLEAEQNSGHSVWFWIFVIGGAIVVLIIIIVMIDDYTGGGIAFTSDYGGGSDSSWGSSSGGSDFGGFGGGGFGGGGASGGY